MKAWLLCLAMLLPIRGAGAQTVAAPPSVVTLRNGARLVALYEPASSQVVFDVFFAVDAEDEKPAGIAALVTRAWLGGDARFRSAALMQRDFNQTGSALGTARGEDWAEIYLACAAGNPALVRQAAQTLLVNLVPDPVFSPALVAAAQQAQTRALALRAANPLEAVLDGLRARVWSQSARGAPLLGTPQNLARVQASDLRAFYRRVFRPDRAVVVVAGNLPPSEARRLVEQSFGAADWRPASLPASARPPVAETIAPALRDRKMTRADFPAALWAAGALAPGTQTVSPRDWAALLIFDAVVGGGKASRGFALRENAQIGYEVRTRLAPQRAQSLWAVYVVGTGAPAATKQAVNVMLDDLASGTQPITDAELVRAKALLCGQHRAERQSLFARSFGAGWAEVMGLGAGFDTDYDALINAVTRDEVTRAARSVLRGNRAVVFLGAP